MPSIYSTAVGHLVTVVGLSAFGFTGVYLQLHSRPRLHSHFL